jgi:hypothetical protein
MEAIEASVSREHRGTKTFHHKAGSVPETVVTEAREKDLRFDDDDDDDDEEEEGADVVDDDDEDDGGIDEERSTAVDWTENTGSGRPVMAYARRRTAMAITSGSWRRHSAVWKLSLRSVWLVWARRARDEVWAVGTWFASRLRLRPPELMSNLSMRYRKWNRY